jgi:Acetyltransferase (GNAT) domain
MTTADTIQYVPHAGIDKSKWDNCVHTASSGLIYNYSFYLDQMADNWDALILGDYKAVMPLTWKKKLGIRYLYQPFLTAQSGITGTIVTTELLEKFIQAIPAHFKFIEISLNKNNLLATDNISLLQKNNYVLNLNRPYDTIYANYSENIKRNLKRAAQAGCQYTKNINPEDVINFAMKQMETYGKAEQENVERFRKLYTFLSKKEMAGTYGITINDTLMASAIFFYSHNRAYYILVGNNPEGKTTGASHALIDGFIKDNAAKNLLFDFEGSDIPGLANFYSSFGAVLEPYPALRINRLPFYLKWLKK